MKLGKILNAEISRPVTLTVTAEQDKFTLPKRAPRLTRLGYHIATPLKNHSVENVDCQSAIRSRLTHAQAPSSK